MFYIVCAICVACLCGCDTSERFGGGSREGEMVLRLSLGSLTRSGEQSSDTRADDTAFVELNENKVSSLEVFLYDSTATDTTDAVYATRVENLDKSGSFDITLTVPNDVIETLFPRNTTTCKVYVIANYETGRTENLELTSVAELKSMPLEAAFNETKDVDLTASNAKYGTVTSVKPQEHFVMDSDMETVTKVDKDLTGTVYLTRAASKITLRTTIAQELVVNNKTWVPMLNDLTLSYHNVANKGFVDNNSDDDTNNTFAMPTGDDVYADIDGVQMSSIFSDSGVVQPEYGSEVEGASDWITVDHIVPFYSYSSRWDDGDDNEAYITLTIPWMVRGDDGELLSETLTYYSYFVPINMNDMKLVRNKHYRINLRVGVLGDIEIEQVNDTNFSYEIIDWVGQNIEAGLQKPLYLVVESNYVELYNVTSISVAFEASGDVVFNSGRTSIPYNNSYSDVTSSTIKGWVRTTVNGKTYISEGCVNKAYSLTIADGKVTFTHEMDNVLTEDKNDLFDFLPQTVVVRIYLKDNKNIYQDITFVQYPAMYVNTYKGNNSANVANYITVNGNNSWGNRSTVGGQIVYWTGLGGKTVTGQNPDIYEVTVSSFDATTSEYIIADPRGEPVDFTLFKGYNNGNGSSAPDYAVQPDQRGVNQLLGYRPALMGENAENLIAPKFIIASFLSTCTLADTYLYIEDSAYYRCAAYQEMGYPAGRWRIPTAAELKLIGQMCAKGMLPSIFTDMQNYPSSTGNYKYSKDGTFTPTNDPATSVRCVYDTWYWRDKCKNNQVNNVRLLWAADGNVEDMKNSGVYDNYLQLIE